jgi:adenine-specific DNA-methyltransferase
VAGIKISTEFDVTADFILYQGNCMELLNILPNDFAKLIITSPPYNLGKEYESKLSIREYVEQQRGVIEECIRILHPNGSICWQVGNYVENGEIIPLDVLLYPIFADNGLHMRNRVIWHFGHGLHASKRFSGRYETIIWFTKSDEYTFNLDPIRIPQKYPKKKHFKGPNKGKFSGNPLGKNPGDVWNIPNVKANHIEKTEHPCQFPVELIERLILSMTNKEDWVLDPFIGTGTSAIAALMHNRKAIGAEIVPKYIEIAKERIQLAEKGTLKIRPMRRPVYDPDTPNRNIPPENVSLGAIPSQNRLFEKREKFNPKKDGK